MSFTVVPLHRFTLPPAPHVTFGGGFVLQNKPTWLQQDRNFSALSMTDQDKVHFATHALIAEYDAATIYDPDPSWKGANTKSFQETKDQQAMLANLSLWLTQPSPVCFTTIFHARSWAISEAAGLPPVIELISNQPALHCLPKNAGTMLTPAQVTEAGRLHTILTEIPPKNSLWQGLRMSWAALCTSIDDLRYPLFWSALESLFGLDDHTRQFSIRMRQRIARFLTDDIASQDLIDKQTMECYKMRSKIVHGRWLYDPNLDRMMGYTEDFVRRSLLRILNRPDLVSIFQSEEREKYMNQLVAGLTTNPRAGQK
jgi:hypothetical protein